METILNTFIDWLNEQKHPGRILLISAFVTALFWVLVYFIIQFFS